jgi:hypothetical protein
LSSSYHKFRGSLNLSLDLGLLFSFIYFLIFSAFSHEKTGTRWFGGGVEAGRNSRKRKNRRPSGFPNNKAKTALKLPLSWLRNAQLLRSQTELFAT